jgi:hypothetical protein
MSETKVTKTEELNVMVGQKIAELLGLKVNKLGRMNTSWGTKTILGLGACIVRIVEESKSTINE